MTRDRIEDALRRPDRYWMADGITEIAMGFLWLLLGVATLLPIVFPNRRVIAWQSVMAMIVLGTASVVLRYGIQAAKKRVTFPRTGYAALRRPNSVVLWTCAAVSVLIVSVIAWLWRAGLGRFDAWLPLGAAVGIGVLFCQAGLRTGIARFFLLGCLAAATGAFLTLMRLPWKLALSILFLVTGAACLASGLFVLRAYLKAHPRPAGEQE